MTATLGQLAQLVNGTVVGDANAVIQAARPLQEAQSGDITFLEKVDKLPALSASQAGAAVVPLGVLLQDRNLIQVADPLRAFVTIFKQFLGKPTFTPTGIDPRAIVHPTAKIGADVSIDAFASVGPHCVIGNRARIEQNVVIGADCRLGDDVHLYPNVVLYEDCVLGDRVTIHANSVIGADGFGYRFQNGRHVKVPQLGGVILSNDVEVGANTTIDRGTFQATFIGEGTKIDNLVQIAHNCKIGKHNVIASQVGIAGSTTSGNYVIMAGQAGVADHCNIGDGALLAAKCGVNGDVPARARMFGYPAEPERIAARMLTALRRLPETARDLKRILEHLGLAGPEQKKDAA